MKTTSDKPKNIVLLEYSHLRILRLSWKCVSMENDANMVVKWPIDFKSSRDKNFML